MHRLHPLIAAALLALAGCASTPPAAPERPSIPIDVRPVRGTDRFRVVTDGLEPEVSVEGVRQEDAGIARVVLESTLAALSEGPKPGAVVELRLGPATTRVQLVSAASNALLVVDVPPTDASVHPVNALATAAFAQAWEAWNAGDEATARKLALASVRIHPGNPLDAAAGSTPPGTNVQNHLAWALLAQITDGSESERWYVGALERSSRYLAAQLGATPAALLEPDRDELFAAARAIVRANQEAMAHMERRGGPGGPVEIPSPIRSGGEAQQILLPADFLGLYAAEPAATLLRDDRWIALAVDAFERLRADPVELLLATREIRSIYLQEDLFAPAPAAGSPEEKMLSALIADVARKAAAGLTEAEVAATLGADADPRVLGVARAKLGEQRDREAAWYGAALHAAEP